MVPQRVTLFTLPGDFAICRLGPDAPIPEWAASAGFSSITRTDDELSIVCSKADVPGDTQADEGWKALKVRGPLAFTQTGVLASLVGPLAEADITVFAVSTYDTDYLLVKQHALPQAVSVLRAHGHQIA